MPSLVMKRGRHRYVATPWYQGRRGPVKWFPDASRKSYREAVQWEDQQIKKMKAEASIDTAFLNVCNWVDDYMDHIESHKYSKKTIQEKKAAFARLEEHDPGIARKAPSAIDRYFAAALFDGQMKTRTGNAVNKDRKNLGAAWQWGRDHYREWPIGDNPFLAVPKKPADKTPRYVPPEVDFWKVFEHVEAAAAGGSDEQLQDRVMLTAYLHLAARRSELFRATWSDLDWANGRIRLWTRKRAGGAFEFDWLPVTDELQHELTLWAERRLAQSTPDKEHIFVCLSNLPCCEQYYGLPFTQRRAIMAKWCKRAKVSAFGWHAIRHLTASILYRLGYPKSHIQAVLRHKSASTTDIYLRSLGVNEVRETLNQGLSRAKVIHLDEKRTASGGDS